MTAAHHPAILGLSYSPASGSAVSPAIAVAVALTGVFVILMMAWRGGHVVAIAQICVEPRCCAVRTTAGPATESVLRWY